MPLAVVVLAVVRPGLLTSGLGSWRAMAVGAGVGVAGLVVLGALWRRSAVAALWSASVVVLALMAVVIWPALRERTLVEAFPTPAAIPSPAASAAPTPIATPDATPVATPAARPTATPTATPAAGPVAVARGTFHGIGHDASGAAVVYRLGGRLVLRFEGISFQGTPTPVVHLVAAGKRSPGGGVRVGGLKAEHGSFAYDVPAGAPVVRVLVWCQRYAVPIAAADLTVVR